MVMATAASKRIFQDVWVCMRCNAKNTGQKGKKPAKCRKCDCKRLRLKKKGKKKAG